MVSKRRARTPTEATPSSPPLPSVRAGGTSGPSTPRPGTTPSRRGSRWRETRSRTEPSAASPTAGAGSSTPRFTLLWSAWVTARPSAVWFGRRMRFASGWIRWWWSPASTARTGRRRLRRRRRSASFASWRWRRHARRLARRLARRFPEQIRDRIQPSRTSTPSSRAPRRRECAASPNPSAGAYPSCDRPGPEPRTRPAWASRLGSERIPTPTRFEPDGLRRRRRPREGSARSARRTPAPRWPRSRRWAASGSKSFARRR
mmetsp:Transcript_1352/g.5510  ORF Transcript_1352/g.5510 Transcript_1352/m.5510 type:complete len:260 (-) Transcript_1352:190-969(-)